MPTIDAAPSPAQLVHNSDKTGDQPCSQPLASTIQIKFKNSRHKNESFLKMFVLIFFLPFFWHFFHFLFFFLCCLIGVWSFFFFFFFFFFYLFSISFSYSAFWFSHVCPSACVSLLRCFLVSLFLFLSCFFSIFPCFFFSVFVFPLCFMFSVVLVFRFLRFRCFCVSLFLCFVVSVLFVVPCFRCFCVSLADANTTDDMVAGAVVMRSAAQRLS